MARYWDYPTATTPYWSSAGNWTNSTASSSTTSTTAGTASAMPRYAWRSTADNSSTATTSTWSSPWVWVVEVRRYLIESPEHWTEGDEADFTYLINDATKTGFTVKMIIKGDIKITDPSIERRTMADFIPLLLRAANADDQKIIRDFFEAHPIINPEGEAP